jgi:hypothetical protein
MRGRSKPDECNVWSVLNRGGVVAGREFIFRAGPAPIALVALLYANTSLDGNFTIPNELTEIFDWRPSRFAAARRVLVRSGYLEVVRIGSRKRAAVYESAARAARCRPSFRTAPSQGMSQTTVVVSGQNPARDGEEMARRRPSAGYNYPLPPGYFLPPRFYAPQRGYTW